MQRERNEVGEAKGAKLTTAKSLFFLAARTVYFASEPRTKASECFALHDDVLECVTAHATARLININLMMFHEMLLGFLDTERCRKLRKHRLLIQMGADPLRYVRTELKQVEKYLRSRLHTLTREDIEGETAEVAVFETPDTVLASIYARDQ